MLISLNGTLARYLFIFVVLLGRYCSIYLTHDISIRIIYDSRKQKTGAEAKYVREDRRQEIYYTNYHRSGMCEF